MLLQIIDAPVDSGPGWSREVWQQLAEIGILGDVVGIPAAGSRKGLTAEVVRCPAERDGQTEALNSR